MCLHYTLVINTLFYDIKNIAKILMMNGTCLYVLVFRRQPQWQYGLFVKLLLWQ